MKNQNGSELDSTSLEKCADSGRLRRFETRVEAHVNQVSFAFGEEVLQNMSEVISKEFKLRLDNTSIENTAPLWPYTGSNKVD